MFHICHIPPIFGWVINLQYIPIFRALERHMSVQYLGRPSLLVNGDLNKSIFGFIPGFRPVLGTFDPHPASPGWTGSAGPAAAAAYLVKHGSSQRANLVAASRYRHGLPEVTKLRRRSLVTGARTATGARTTDDFS